MSDDDRLTGYPDSLLKTEMLRVGVSIQGLAKLMAGPGGSHAQSETARTSIRRWLRTPAMGITARSSARLAPHFERPSDYFERPAQPRTRQRHRLEELEAAVKTSDANLTRLVAELTERVEALEGRESTGQEKRA